MFPVTVAPPPPQRPTDALRDRAEASPAESEFLSAFDRIAETSGECGYQADILSWAAGTRFRRRRNLSFLAGMLALICCATVASLFTRMVPTTQVEYVAILTALCSGMITLINTHFHDDGEIERLLGGAAELRAVQKAAELLRDRPLFIELETKARLAAAGDRGRPTLDGHARPDQGPRQAVATAEQRDREFRMGAESAYNALSELRQRQTDAASYRPHVAALIAANQIAYERRKRKTVWGRTSRRLL